MSWKEIKRIEQIIRKERGDKAVSIRLIKEKDKVSSVILGIEDKNSKNSIKLSIEEWDNLLSFFNAIDDEIKVPNSVILEEEKEIRSHELEKETHPEVIIQEPSKTLPEAKVIGSAFEEPSSTVTLIHKDMTSPSETLSEITSPELEEKIPLPTFVDEQIEPPSEVIVEPIEIEKPPPTPTIVLEEEQPQVEIKPISYEIEKPPAPPTTILEEEQPQIEVKPISPEVEKLPSTPAIVLEQIEQSNEARPKITESEPSIPSPVLIPDESPIITENQDIFPEMPPEVKEIFEELDTQAIELEKSLIMTDEDSSDSELTKEVKITKAMQEVAELMPSGPAKEFVEQMIVKRKETKEVPEEMNDESKKEESSSNKKELKNDIDEEELKYW